MYLLAQSSAVPWLEISPFWVLLLGIPVLLLGERLQAMSGVLRRSNIPAAVLGGLIVAVGILLIDLLRPGALVIRGSTDNPFWLWLLTPSWELVTPKATDVERPLLILFFTCIGLNASWAVARRGGIALVVYLALATGLAVIQGITGVLSAIGMGQSPLMGLMCSSVSLMGGFGTAAGFAPEFAKAGLADAATIGVAAAAFGVIAGGLVAGPLAGALIRRHCPSALKRGAGSGADVPEETPAGPDGFIAEGLALLRSWKTVLVHLATLAVCLKLGAFVSAFISSQGITFPVYIGSMLVASAVRNLHDLAGMRRITNEGTDAIGSFCLAWLLAVVMIDMKLAQLAGTAGPMLVILALQVVITAAVSYTLVFRLMGRDYEAAAMSAGMIGFGLGATSNAVATMRTLARSCGPAPRAFLIVTVVGAFLIDFANAALITLGLNLVGP